MTNDTTPTQEATHRANVLRIISIGGQIEDLDIRTSPGQWSAAEDIDVDRLIRALQAYKLRRMRRAAAR
jgi:hypothetical protein